MNAHTCRAPTRRQAGLLCDILKGKVRVTRTGTRNGPFAVDVRTWSVLQRRGWAQVVGRPGAPTADVEITEAGRDALARTRT